MIKLEKIKEERKKNKLVLLFKGSNEVFANTIRRMIIEEVPTLAVEDLEIKAVDYGTAVEVVSSETEMGNQLKELGSIAGILRFEVY